MVAYEQARQAQQAGHPQRALELLDQVRLSGEISGALRDFYHHLKLDLGYAAAQKGDWAQALSKWREAELAGDDSRALLFNLALAYQHQEQFWESAEHWRTLLRRRPRKADHPDALTDQQVARIWQNIADNYSKVGEFEEAITTYKNALKWAPDSIDLRLKLVDAYQSEGRWQAAENELNRILEKEPDNIAALTLLAESYSDDYFEERPRQIWQRILELEPQNPVARQQLAHTYERESLRWLHWQRDYEKAIEIMKEGLKQVPDSERLRVMMGGAYAEWGKFDQARDYLEQARALKPNDLQTLHTTFTIWLQNKSLPDMEKTLAQLQALASTAPADLFLNLFERCYAVEQKEMAEKILAFVAGQYAADVEAMIAVAANYSELDQDQKALSILRQVIKDHPNHIEANIQLGLAYFYLEQTRLAKRHWDKATSLARQANDQIMLHRIRLMTDELLHGKRPPQSPAELLRNLPPQVLEQMLKDAPPELAEMMRNMPPGMLDILAGFGDFDDEDDDLFDFDDFFK
jgi:tetratricopeptide (TPR) repeat protein